MTEQWQELKETIIELRDNDGTSTQQEICKFLANYMEVLEKQMQELCEDAVSRTLVHEAITASIAESENPYEMWQRIEALPPVTPQQKIGQWRHYEGMLICSECGAEFYDDIMEYCGDDVPKCCPSCGAKMEGVPSVTPRINLALTSQDCISREAAIDVLENTKEVAR